MAILAAQHPGGDEKQILKDTVQADLVCGLSFSVTHLPVNCLYKWAVTIEEVFALVKEFKMSHQGLPTLDCDETILKTEIFQSLLKSSKIYGNLPKSTEIFQNLLNQKSIEIFKIYQNFPKSIEISQKLCFLLSRAHPAHFEF